MYYMQYLSQALVKTRPWESEAGLTVIEYELVATLLALDIVAGTTAIGWPGGTLSKHSS